MDCAFSDLNLSSIHSHLMFKNGPFHDNDFFVSFHPQISIMMQLIFQVGQAYYLVKGLSHDFSLSR